MNNIEVIGVKNLMLINANTVGMCPFLAAPTKIIN